MLAESPAVVIQGARQVGKSTLVAQTIKRHGGQVFSLDDDNTLLAAQASPTEFVRQPVQGILAIDEVQRAPGLLVAVKAAIDIDRRPGRFLLTGSADLLHVSGASESLAGRAETLKLWGLSQGERLGMTDDFISWVTKRHPVTGRQFDQVDYPALIVDGGYPEAIRRSQRGRTRWFDNYAHAIVDHDAAEVSGLEALDRLGTLLRLAAATTSQELVLAGFSRLTGIPQRSLPPYLRLLDDLYLTQRLAPWGRNLAKRVVGRPKLHLADTGLAAHLSGVTDAMLNDVFQRPKLGGLLESFVLAELVKQQSWSATTFRLFHFRDSTGPEVDLVAELSDGKVVGIEVKSAADLGNSDFKGLAYLRDKLGEQFVQGVVLYTGQRELPWGDRLRALPVSALWQLH
ncbi:MAG: ATP-binding protein [Micrococcales bacterium]|nr:ATP-binding protein [Micrococcales bacterium]